MIGFLCSLGVIILLGFAVAVVAHISEQAIG